MTISYQTYFSIKFKGPHDKQKSPPGLSAVRRKTEWDYLLAKKSLSSRVTEKRKQRISKDVEIVPYQHRHPPAFKKLNEEWIRKYFKIEEPDRLALENPKK